MKRLMYWAPRGVTRPWVPRIERGGDEWHNPSLIFIGPLGALIVFHGRFSRDGEEHIHTCFKGEWEGAFHPDCDTCVELIEDQLEYERRHPKFDHRISPAEAAIANAALKRIAES